MTRVGPQIPAMPESAANEWNVAEKWNFNDSVFCIGAQESAQNDGLSAFDNENGFCSPLFRVFKCLCAKGSARPGLNHPRSDRNRDFPGVKISLGSNIQENTGLNTLSAGNCG